MKRRILLKSLVAAPVAVAAQLSPKDTSGTQLSGLPAGPHVVEPAATETPTIPVVPADQTSEELTTNFTADQIAAFRKLADLLMPTRNGLPGASEANAPEFLAFLISCSPKEKADLYRNGLDALNQRSTSAVGKPFTELDAAQAAQILAPLREAWTYGAAEGGDFRAFLIAAKRDLLRATVNSRVYIEAVSQFRRPRNASRFYWYRID